MHIAICDDNIADRKQMERLLARESDRRKTDSGGFYVNSFGNSEVLGRSPMQYDLFFIDMVNEDPDGYDFAMELIRTGVTAPIVLCISSVDYRALYRQTKNAPVNISFLEKPVKTDALRSLLNHAIALRSEKSPTIELRTEKETFYLQEQDIICARTESHYVNVSLADGRVIPITGELRNLYDQMAFFPSFFLLSQKAFININHIDKCSFFKVTMQNGISLSISPEFSFALHKLIRHWVPEVKEES